MPSENQLVARIARALGADPISFAQRKSPRAAQAGLKQIAKLRAKPLIRLGLGDDAAVVDLPGRSRWVLSCDWFLEGVHFLADTHPADSVGYKALARATSDLAAMGATPRYFLLSLALPGSRTQAWLGGFLRGMARASRELGIQAIGGDTTQYPNVLVSVTVLGQAGPGGVVARSGAKPGDTIFVSGPLGGAALGLWLLQNSSGRASKSLKGLFRSGSYQRLLQPHLYPPIRVGLGSWLARHRVASAMMDISDGLSTDLPRLCAASGVGARVWAGKIPQKFATLAVVNGAIHGAITVLSGSNHRPLSRAKPSRHGQKDGFLTVAADGLNRALHGGEDYELLFTVPRSALNRLSKAPGAQQLTAIGEITASKRVVLVGTGGKVTKLAPRGWDPFQKR